MSQPTLSLYLSAGTPAPDDGFINSQPRTVIDGPYQDASLQLPNAWGMVVKTADYLALPADGGLLLVFNKATAVQLTLPTTPPPGPSGWLSPAHPWKIEVQNIGAGALTVNPNGLNLDGSVSSLVLTQNQGCGIRTDGANYFTMRGIGGTPPAIVSAVGISIDGGASTPPTGSRGYVPGMPYAGTITAWELLADQSGSAQITVKKCADAGFPTTSSIVAADPPALVSQQKNGSSSLGTWTTAVAIGDIFEFNLDSVTTCTRLYLKLSIVRS